jgi:hypothetical protein
LRYLVSLDLCEGEDQSGGEDPDKHSALVWRAAYVNEKNRLHHQDRLVARLMANRLPIDVLALMVHRLALWFGGCLVIPEMPNSGLASLKCAQTLGTPIWQREEWNLTKTKVTRRDGWRTTDGAGHSGIRTQILQNLERRVREMDVEIADQGLISELLGFVDTGKRWEAGPRKHDDDVLSAAIGLFNVNAATEYNIHARIRLSGDGHWRHHFAGDSGDEPPGANRL